MRAPRNFVLPCVGEAAVLPNSVWLSGRGPAWVSRWRFAAHPCRTDGVRVRPRVGGAKAWYGARPMSAVRQLECRSGAERVLSREWQGANRPGRRYRNGRADSAISTRFVVEVDGRPATAAIRERESQGRTAMNTRAHWRIRRRRGCARQRAEKPQLSALRGLPAGDDAASLSDQTGPRPLARRRCAVGLRPFSVGARGRCGG